MYVTSNGALLVAAAEYHSITKSVPQKQNTLVVESSKGLRRDPAQCWPATTRGISLPYFGSITQDRAFRHQRTNITEQYALNFNKVQCIPVRFCGSCGVQLVEVEYYSMNMLCLLAEHSIRQSLANRLVLTFLGSRGPLSLTPFCTDLTFLRFTKLLSPLVSCLPVPLFHFFN